MPPHIKQTWNGTWAVHNSAGIMTSIPYISREKAEAALERIKKHTTREKGDLF